MPSSITVKHPNLPGWSITFTEADHTYVDNQGRKYQSVTTIIHDHFPRFDAQANAARIAKRDNRLEMDILAEWDRKSKEACDYGTRVHEFAEAMLKGTQLAQPACPKDQWAFDCVRAAVDGLSAHYDFIASEQLVFDPLYCVAGTIDLLMRNRKTGAIVVLDWKTNEAIETEGFRGETGTGICADLQNCNMAHYSLQLSTYQYLLADMEIFPAGTIYERALIYIPPLSKAPQWITAPDLTKHAERIVDEAWRKNTSAQYQSRELLIRAKQGGRV